MPKYWGINYFAHVSFPEVGQKQKTEKKKEKSVSEKKFVLQEKKLRKGYLVQTQILVRKKTFVRKMFGPHNPMVSQIILVPPRNLIGAF